MNLQGLRDLMLQFQLGICYDYMLFPQLKNYYHIPKRKEATLKDLFGCPRWNTQKEDFYYNLQERLCILFLHQ